MKRLTCAILVMVFLALAIEPASSARSEANTGLIPFLLEEATQMPPVGAASAGSLGHIDQTGFLRIPVGFPLKQPSDHIVFESDAGGAPAIRVSGADVGDSWTFKWFTPAQTPGSDPPDSSCVVEFVDEDHPDNPTGVIALIGFCPGDTAYVLSAHASCPCSTGLFTVLLAVAGWGRPLGTWTLVIDFTDSSGAATANVHTAPMHITRTPAVLLTHGYDDQCGNFDPQDIDTSMEDLWFLLTQELAIPASQIQCFEYDSRKGVDAAAIGLAAKVRNFRSSLALPPDAEVDLVGHSMGGLVIRFYYEHRYGSPDGPIGSLSMLGTPNTGVWLAKHEKGISQFCHSLILVGPACALADWSDLEESAAAIDVESVGVQDMEPDSNVLDRLGELRDLPDRPLYRAQIGGDGAFLGRITSLSSDNDCLVADSSVRGHKIEENGNERIFELVATDYSPASHDEDIAWCGSTSLTNHTPIAANIGADIRSIAPNPPEGSGAASPPEPPQQLAAISSTWGVSQASVTNTHSISVPSGLSDVTFAALWLDAEVESSLTVELLRPNGQVVQPNDSDVLEALNVVGDTPLDTLIRGYVIETPQAGNWQLRVTGASVPTGGEAYNAIALTQTVVTMAGAVLDDSLTQGQPAVVTASLLDAEVRGAATITATVIRPGGTDQVLTLVDNGTSGDSLAGDLIYSGSFTTTNDCGEYPVRLTGTGATSEGTVTRATTTGFSVSVLGDAVRDPCDIDEDNDGCADSEELGIIQAQGGKRDPLTRWDFADVPAPTSGTGTDGKPILGPTSVRSKAVSLADVGVVLGYVGRPATNIYYTSDLNNDGTPDGEQLDRSPSVDTTQQWRSGPPNGGISLQDVGVVLAQVGHSCVPAP